MYPRCKLQARSICIQDVNGVIIESVTSVHVHVVVATDGHSTAVNSHVHQTLSATVTYLLVHTPNVVCHCHVSISSHSERGLPLSCVH